MRGTAWSRRFALLFAAVLGACTSGGDYASEPELGPDAGHSDAKADAVGVGGAGWPDAGGSGGTGATSGTGGTTSSGGGPAVCPDGACESGETCSSCPQDCGACCGNSACDNGESCATCPQDCGACCGNGACDNAETCATCPGDCGACCGNTLCDNGENCDSCPGDCGCGQCYARCCSGNALYGPKWTQNGDACKDWGTWGTQCGSINNLVRVSFNNGLYWEQPNRCWVWCNNFTVYHLLTGVTSGCAAAGQSYCQSHGGYVGVLWQYCDPN